MGEAGGGAALEVDHGGGQQDEVDQGDGGEENRAQPPPTPEVAAASPDSSRSHDTRREELGTALWRVVAQDGIEAASLRRVAREAGWSVGSVRHYFASQQALLAFAMELVVEQVTARVRRRLDEHEGDPDLALTLACEVLPLDDERRVEARVWLAFTALAAVSPAFGAVYTQAHTGVRQLSAIALRLAGTPPEHVDAEAERLHPLLDGVTLHMLLAPATTTPDRARALVGDALGGAARRSSP